MNLRFAAIGAFSLLSVACVSFPDALPGVVEPQIAGDAVISVDGSRLGLTVWKADAPVAAIVAVHGMNDYAAAFTYAGPIWAEHGISVYAYDQRGFGRSPGFRRWAGAAPLKQDLRAVIAAVRDETGGLPLYVVGHSLGAAVVLAAMKDAPLAVDGVVLAAPGVWGGGSMSIFYRGALNLAATFAPGETLTGEAAGRQASDNLDFLRKMYNDPRVIKETRLDAILGAERMMGEAFDASDEIGGDILFLYGEKDDIIPVKALRKSAARLCGDATTIVYPEGWHLLFADLQRERAISDVAKWIAADLDGKKFAGADPNAACGAAPDSTVDGNVAATRPGAG